MPSRPSTPILPPEQRRAAARSAALPDDELLAECEVEIFIASGPGGQHRNKAETAVRLRHLPSGVVVTATERRSQSQNRSTAIARLRERLVKRSLAPKPRKKTKPTMGSQRRRLEAKKRLGEKKRERGRFD
jgi:protein subunit release factor B